MGAFASMVSNNRSITPIIAGGALLAVCLLTAFSCSSPSPEGQKKMDAATQQALKDRSHIKWEPLPTWGDASPTPSATAKR
jgi:hypothetical protein